MTDANGVATCHGSVPLTAFLAFNYCATFAGTSIYRPSQATGGLT